MKNEIEIKIDFEDKITLETILSAIEVEVVQSDSDRASVELNWIETTLIIQIIASDFVALRALTNSIMRLMKTSLEILDIF
ncbi:MAG: KEOPS complex subunit Pcc1 [Candidatus Heimdallarchaeota archaeon]|nr:KEOPS complex subunit Pcc1 [Candidatus Heimdallarchaeota archaeon]MDH5646756.1 KEOPS complex subunit Pcc1 [Candidatus Heimdallarchaeota archaeon]